MFVAVQQRADARSINRLFGIHRLSLSLYTLLPSTKDRLHTDVHSTTFSLPTRERGEREKEKSERGRSLHFANAREHCCKTFAMHGLTPAAYAAWLIKARQWTFYFQKQTRAQRAQKETSAFLYEAPLCKFDARVRRIVNKNKNKNKKKLITHKRSRCSSSGSASANTRGK